MTKPLWYMKLKSFSGLYAMFYICISFDILCYTLSYYYVIYYVYFLTLPQAMTGRLVLAVASSAMGMFNFGYNTGVINAPQEVLVLFFYLIILKNDVWKYLRCLLGFYHIL